MLLHLPLARYEWSLYLLTWLATLIMISVDEWRQEQTFRAQQEALDNIQQMLAQLLVNCNTNDAGSNHDEEEHNNDERSKTEKSKESFSIDVEVIEGIQAQIVSLAQRDKLKKVG